MIQCCPVCSRRGSCSFQNNLECYLICILNGIVSQDVNTTGFVERMLLNLLMTFAQYEMEMTPERIRDKIAECSRQRKFCAACRRWATKKIRIRINLSLFPCTRFRTRRKSPFCSYFSRFFNGKIMKIKKRYSELKIQKIASR